MNSTAQLSDTEINQAKLLSQLSGRPAHVNADVFVWNGRLIDRATAIVALLKTNNAVPVSDSVKMQMHSNYLQKFRLYEDSDDLAFCFDNPDRPPDENARIWFNAVCRAIKKQEVLPNDLMKQILIDLHKN